MLNIKKTAALLLTSAVAVSSLFACNEKKPHDMANAKELKVTFLDVGKADAIVLQSESSTVVIDCGEKGDGKKISSILEESGTTVIDYLIITHFDKDHVGGAPKVLKTFDVKNVLTPDYTGNVSEYDKFAETLDGRGITPMKLKEDISFTLDDVDYTVYAPKKDFYGDGDSAENNFSLVTKAVHHNNILLFTGDAMEERLDEIMDIGKCTLLKVPYHGRKLDNLGDFLKATEPKCAVVCTDSNEFSGKMQDLLKKQKINTYATCFNGKINAVSDGSQIKIDTEKGSSL
ncbi:ComEC/Rec2 family competence protein [Ruminococcus flavefaciens]|uniref:Metal-dependent hydrolase, beta-lactamase superfamily II n=1 Tax=Ruminococcus flavefaciens TaxID=1265 RepID=A0A1K1P050_RUMFL|nr:MBL fold metallo-hydrolase [Ruminococcus flavefaciens]SFW40959.1 Metal-dependent hydrolase, beta-lactamase superfamily II [Ruminococcus flavefaciens]